MSELTDCALQRINLSDDQKAELLNILTDLKVDAERSRRGAMERGETGWSSFHNGQVATCDSLMELIEGDEE